MPEHSLTSPEGRAETFERAYDAAYAGRAGDVLDVVRAYEDLLDRLVPAADALADAVDANHSCSFCEPDRPCPQADAVDIYRAVRAGGAT